MVAVASLTGAQLGKDIVAVRTPEDAAAARSKVQALLKRPLTADAAVQVALLNNRGLQAAYNELGANEVAAIRASLPASPIVSLSRVAGSGGWEIERQIAFNILSLATTPARADVASLRIRQAHLRAAEETLRIAADARRAYYAAVAGRELVRFLEQAQSAAQVAATLVKRLGETGALSKLDQAREQVFLAEISAQLATARQRASSERERLVRSLGLWGGDIAFQLPNALPPLPPRPHALPAVEAEAVQRRIDLQIARLDVEALAKSYGLTQATRFLDLLELSGLSTSAREDGGRVNQRGVEAELQVPLFDFGETRVRQAEQSYMQAVNRLAQKAVDVRSEARDAYRTYRSLYDIAAHYRREILPLRKIISDETLLHYNAMQIDVFALLTEARQRIAATNAAIEAQREFWRASTNLMTAVVGGGTAAAGDGSSMATVPAESAGGGH
jgi:outer membrane protein TolC